MTRVGVVTGMIAESRCLGAALQQIPPANRPLIYCAGANLRRAQDGTRALIDQGVEALMSFGLAGGLAPGTVPGDLLCATEVLDADGGKWPTNEMWRQSLSTALASDADAPLFCSPEPIASVEMKARLHLESGATAVDMESAAVAAGAADASLPFVALRVIVDPASRAIPESALRGLGPNGEQRPLAVLTALLTRPGDLAGLIRLGRDTAHGMRRLRRVAALGEVLFAGPFGRRDG